MTMENTLEKFFGYKSFRPQQREIIESVMSQHNTLGVLPTGSGKSICYQIPTLMQDGLTLVISPLIALMHDQVEELINRGIPAVYLNSTLSQKEIATAERELLDGQYKFLYASPERIVTPEFQEYIKQLDINLIAFDEAHCISKWGHDFRPSYQNIIPVIHELFEGVPTIAVTATATQEVQENITSLLGIAEAHIFNGPVKRENLHLMVNPTFQRDQFILNYVLARPKEAGIIYAATRAEVEKLSIFLTDNNIENVPYHGGLKKTERGKNQELFIRNTVPLIVATNAFGMGINKPDIRYIIHNNLPGDIESYYQEVGRAGRDGLPSECILLSSARDINLHQYFIDRSDATNAHKQNKREKLDKMMQYQKTNKCLTGFVTKYFNPNEYVTECGRCSNCLSQKRTYDMTEEARSVLSLIMASRVKLTKSLVIQVLRGERNEDIHKYKLNENDMYGTMQDYIPSDIHHILDELIYRGYVHIEDEVLRVLIKGRLLIDGKREIYTEPFKQNLLEKVDISTDQLPSIDLYEKLLHVRKELAEKHDIEEDMIFTDQVIKEFAKKKPTSKEEMVYIEGVGSYKLKHYCPYFLEEIESHIANITM